MSYIGLLRYDDHTFIRNIRGVIRKMSNDTVPVLEDIDGEEHHKGDCCVKLKCTKTINGITYYIHVRICNCKRHLPSKEFWHTLQSCHYKSIEKLGNPFKIKAFCTCNRPRKAYTR